MGNLGHPQQPGAAPARGHDTEVRTDDAPASDDTTFDQPPGTNEGKSEAGERQTDPTNVEDLSNDGEPVSKEGEQQ